MTFPVDPTTGVDPHGFQAADPDDGLAAPTLVDPEPSARAAFQPDPRPDPDRLPPSLADRFHLLEPLPRHGERTEDRKAEAARSAELRASVFRVQDRRSPGQPVRVLKWFHPAAAPDPKVTSLLRPGLHPGLSYVVEEGTADGAPYHVLPSHGSTDLAAYLRGRDGHRMPADGIRTMVARLHEALTALHAAEVVHRDVKPSNLVLGDYDHPAGSLVLVDFGIAVTGPFPVTAPGGWSGTLRYASPQAVLHRAAVRPEDDWWALGMVVAEAALGRHPIPHLEPSTVGQAVMDGDFALERIGDARIRLLCEGLLTRRLENRWGGRQVGDWLAEDRPDPLVVPPVPGPRTAPGPQPAPDAPAFSHEGRTFTATEPLGAEFDAHWDAMAARLNRGRERARLRAWLETFRPDGDAPRAEALDRLLEGLQRRPAPGTLIDLITWLAPRQEPSYRGLPLDMADLPDVAANAAAGDGQCLSVVADLHEHRLLPLLGRRRGGEELAYVDRRWQDHDQQWREAAGRIDHIPELADDRDRVRAAVAVRPRLTAELLQLAARPAPFLQHLRRQVRRARAALPAPVPWFTRLTGSTDPVTLLLALRLHHLALEQARQRWRADQEARLMQATDRHAQHWLMVMRRLELPVVLGRAAGGALLLFFPHTFVVALADLYDAPQATVVTAWLLSVPCLAALLAVECWTAWYIGYRYHPDFSLMGQISRRSEPLTRRVRGRGWRRMVRAVPVLLVLAAVFGAAWGTFRVAAWIWPLATVLGLLVSAGWRVRAWRRHLAEVRARPLAAPGPTEPDEDRDDDRDEDRGGTA
ncbi:serine/threonine protein kinase [Streptomyces sp. NPDC003247]|uniref:serine/threonine protein kinase n=1 Tax=Streptomyces sp. NPDC003247 TaxID=3364677 RepID=UPI003681085D